MNEAASIIATRIEKLAKEKGSYRRFEYLNYAHPSQKPFEGYGETNLGRLRDASREFDPNSVFQRQVNGGFKLW